MVYSFLRVLIRVLLYIINGRPHYLNRKNLPKGSYILVGPHRTWFDPIYYALAASPKKFSFMAKEELFKNPIIRWILVHCYAFSVNRTNPGPSAIKTPVNILRQGKLSMIIFPSGSRHTQHLKGGAVVIAKMANVPIIPTVYQGPLTFKTLFSRKRATVDFGEPIQIDRKQRMDEAGRNALDAQLQNAFNKLDKEINPDFKYVDVSKK
ncbi:MULTISPECIES: 1-acyl-sn-glycerol-3-phosphate acyltransferase [Pediococcus]|uniref:lysophospholipid acyltransferase family protein n=1 Tax=Pediococcus TaxID=1253 RepID=UPI000E96F21B|nr:MULTISPECIES: 1-acyl-sn-glycerol-3-phosphate acyltransferase [Pediococcus]MCT3029956.1 1-acyl-sn-glycerol-3-phosphate acyltransferase [Pediococcus parvulus]MCT3034223.1 1-acyl-sn-glycerol-3-phosphate acyltransferase [Pediococcus parvulus]HBO47895.1 1-acyl-sn-glycerol-3-phosphate acyltransferase [Pediococcus sp.]